MSTSGSETSASVHPAALVSEDAVLSPGVQVWQHSVIRRGAFVGENTIIGAGVFIDQNTRIGARCKIQNQALIYRGVTLEDGIFIGPGVRTTNDRYPRAINPDGTLKSTEDWVLEETLFREGASVGAGSVVLAGVTIGRFAMIGAGAIVLDSIPDHAMAVGVPAVPIAEVCYCGQRADLAAEGMSCVKCGWRFQASPRPVEAG